MQNAILLLYHSSIKTLAYIPFHSISCGRTQSSTSIIIHSKFNLRFITQINFQPLWYRSWSQLFQQFHQCDIVVQIISGVPPKRIDRRYNKNIENQLDYNQSATSMKCCENWNYLWSNFRLRSSIGGYCLPFDLPRHFVWFPSIIWQKKPFFTSKRSKFE